MAKSKQLFKSFSEFWPHYLSQHSNPINRNLHFIGSCLAFCFLKSVVTSGNWKTLPWIFVLGFGPAWIGHFLFEKNSPTTFSNPFFSLLADFKMVGLMILKKL